MAEERRRKEAEAQEQAAIAATTIVDHPRKQPGKSFVVLLGGSTILYSSFPVLAEAAAQKKPPPIAVSPKQDVPDGAIHNGSSLQTHQVSSTEPEVPLKAKLTSKFSNLWSSKEKEDKDKLPTPSNSLGALLFPPLC